MGLANWPHRLAAAALLACLTPTVVRAAGAEPIVVAVIVAKNRPDQNMGKADLARMFLRKTLLWANREPVQPVNLAAGHPLRRLFSERVVGLEPEELEDYWNGQYFQGVFPPYAVASEEAALRYVAQSTAAIGYVSACAADERVKVVFYLTAAGLVPGAGPSRFCAPR